MIDFIGDIHGHADKLEELLLKLGYKKVAELIHTLLKGPEIHLQKALLSS